MTDAPMVHASAVVDDGATLGAGTRVWHFVHVSEGASIGAGSVLGQNVFVGRGVRVGRRVRVQNNVSLYEGVEIEDDVFLGPSCVFTNVKHPRAHVSRKHAFQGTRVARGASVGANATVVCGVSIGRYAFVAAGAVLTRDVPDFALMIGQPARHVGWVCACGEVLTRELGQADCGVACAGCGASYRQECGRLTEREQSQVAPCVAPSPVPMLDLSAQNSPLRDALEAAFQRVLTSGQFILGPEVAAFEGELCQQLGFSHALGVSSGSDALLLALMALGIGPGDEVITSAFSFFASAGCIARLGARPVFVDIDPATYNLDVEQLGSALSPATRAVVAVHLFGQPADLDGLIALCRARGLALVEDAAQALGATYREKPVGSFGSFGCFSFFPSKNLGGFGDGGLLTTCDPELLDRARRLRSHGAEPKYFHSLLGGNFRLDALQAALLRVKLPQLSAFTERRKQNAAYYDEHLVKLTERGLLTTPRKVSADHVYHQYVVRCQGREAVRQALADAGVETGVYYPLGLHRQSCFADLGYRAEDMPEADRASREVLALPVHSELSSRDLSRVVSVLMSHFGV